MSGRGRRTETGPEANPRSADGDSRDSAAGANETAKVEQRVLGAESPEIVEAATEAGERRLRRLNVAHALTALIGGLAVSFGAGAMAWTAGPWLPSLGTSRAELLGAVAFPIGFIILLIGKGELFTENFFVPVVGVMEGNGTVRELLELWTYTLFFNLVGAAIFAALVTRPGVFGADAKAFMIQYATTKVHWPFTEAFVKGIFAGWLMTVLTWLILAADTIGARMVIIWIVGFLIVAGHFNHVVISAAEIFMAIWLHAPISWPTWLENNFVPALIGNLVGGVIFVTLLGWVQAHSLERDKRDDTPRKKSR